MRFLRSRRRTRKARTGRSSAAWRRRLPPFELLEDRRLLAAVITVNSTADSDVRDDFLTLREALRLNNRTLSFAALSTAEKAQVVGTSTAADADTIQFNIPAADPGHVYYRNDGVAGRVTLASISGTTAADDANIADIDPDWAHSWYSIRPTAELQSIFDPFTINGYSQPGAQENTNPTGQGLNTVLRIELSGQNIDPLFRGLLSVEGGSGTAIRGLVLNRNNSDGQNGALVNLWGSSANCVVQGNFLGTDVSGTLAFAQAYEVYADSPGSMIGGIAPAARNLISGNAEAGSGTAKAALYLRSFGARASSRAISSARIARGPRCSAMGKACWSPRKTTRSAAPIPRPAMSSPRASGWPASSPAAYSFRTTSWALIPAGRWPSARAAFRSVARPATTEF